jgi:hypothetical protein
LDFKVLLKYKPIEQEGYWKEEKKFEGVEEQGRRLEVWRLEVWRLEGVSG